MLVKNRNFSYPPPLKLTLSLTGSTSEYRHKVWYKITRMIWLPESEKSRRIRLHVFTKSTNVTDGQTDTA